MDLISFDCEMELQYSNIMGDTPKSSLFLKHCDILCSVDTLFYVRETHMCDISINSVTCKLVQYCSLLIDCISLNCVQQCTFHEYYIDVKSIHSMTHSNFIASQDPFKLI